MSDDETGTPAAPPAHPSRAAGMSSDTKWIIGTVVVLGGLLSAQIAGVNSRIDDMNGRIADVNANVNARFGDVHRRIDDMQDDIRELRAEVRADIRELREIVINVLKGSEPAD